MDEVNETTEIIQPNNVYYDIDWDKIKTIKHIKELLKVLASKVIIDHNDENDVEVLENLKSFLIKSDDQDQ